MNIVVGYIFPTPNLAKYETLAKRFTQSYVRNPPGKAEHEVYVLCNGDMIDERQVDLFDGVIARFFRHNNFGRDLGAFQSFSRSAQCDLLICLGSHCHFWKAGWLDRIVDAYLQNGPGLYGAWGGPRPNPHIRTTAWWCPPDFLNSYPHIIATERRYEAEHGTTSLTAWAKEIGMPRMVVTWNEVWDEPDWKEPEREQILLLDQHCDARGWKP